MTSVAYLVDGELEKRFLSENCRGSPIRRIGNGDRYPSKVIAKHLLTQIKLLSNRIHHFVVLLDLEDRTQTPKEFAGEILAELQAQGLGNQSLIIVIKEREVEDWILADPQTISEFVSAQVDTEGLHGKGALSRILRDHDIKYHETTVGCDLLKLVHCSRAIHRSASLSYFKARFPAQCWWLDR